MSYYFLEQEGKSRSDAEARALEVLGVSRDKVEFEELTAARGIKNLFKREPSVVRVRPTKDVPPEVYARAVLLTLVRKLGVDATVLQTGERDENLYVELGSEESGFLIGKHGRTLDAIQFLVNLIVNTRTKNDRRIMVDVEEYRDRREKSLKRLASRMAERVARSGRPVLLNYMNPYERRIIHLSLEKDERVYTESDGNGVYKRVRVIPTEKRGRPAGPTGAGRRGGRSNGADAPGEEPNFNEKIEEVNLSDDELDQEINGNR